MLLGRIFRADQSDGIQKFSGITRRDAALGSERRLNDL